MSCYDRVGAFAADRKGGAEQMPGSPFQCFGITAMVDGQVDRDPGDLHIAHNAVPRNIELCVIVLRCHQQSFLTVCVRSTGSKGTIVAVRQFLYFLNLAVIRLIQNFLICGLDC